jgi:rhodanese-related sulfurtransferase
MSGAAGKLRGLVARACVLVAIATVCGAAANVCSPRRIPWTYEWSRHIELQAAKAGIAVVRLADAKPLVESGSHIVLDARPKKEFQQGRLPGAFSVPHNDAIEALKDVQLFLTPTQPVLIYCASSDCDEGLLLCVLLRQQGFRNVSLLVEGYRSWKAAGLEVETGP